MNLGNNLLNGILPGYIFELPSLKKLFLCSNKFFGQLNEFCNASSSLLDIIDVRNNHLNGSTPKAIIGIERLQVLSLSSNLFSETLPYEMIGTLTKLDLSYNNLTIDISSSKSTSVIFPQLRILKLASCRLQKFPHLKFLSKMMMFDLSDNQIQGPIPHWIWEIGYGFPSQLNLSCNLLEYLKQPYNIPDNLVMFDLHSNRLKGDLPIPPSSSFCVDYSSNSFSNSIPLDIGDSLVHARVFSVANNSLTGRIPESICNALFPQVLDFSKNALSRTIPRCLLENSKTLGVLNLRNNSLNGVIPDSFPIGCALRSLDLNENTLQGKLPRSLVNCDLLEVLNIRTNRLFDSFPFMLKNLSSLRVLVLRSNGFYGNFQCHSWQNLQIIDTASNNITGELSAKCLSNWKGIMVGDDFIDSGHNQIHYGYCQEMVTLTIKGMELKLVKNFRTYTFIDFSSNRFHGVFPDMVGNLSALYVFNLSHNVLEGPIPKSIGKLKILESLDLLWNQLSGEILLSLQMSHSYHI